MLSLSINTGFFFCVIHLILCFTHESFGYFDPNNVVSWSSSGGNIRNTRTVEKTNVNEKTISLSNPPSRRFFVNASISSAPALLGHITIFTTDDGHIYAYGTKDDVPKWAFNIKEAYYSDDSSINLYNNKIISVTTPTYWMQTVIICIKGPADILAIDLMTGRLLWKKRLSEHPEAIITGSGTVYNNVYYVGISSKENNAISNPSYGGSTFIGSFHAINLRTKKSLWENGPWVPFKNESNTMETTDITPHNINGVRDDTFTGGEISGSSYPIDLKTKSIFFTVGPIRAMPKNMKDCMSNLDNSGYNIAKTMETCLDELYPDTAWFSSVVALDLTSGDLRSARRFLSYSSWANTCLNTNETNCPILANEDITVDITPSLGEITLAEDDPYLDINHYEDTLPNGRKNIGYNTLTVLYLISQGGITWCLDVNRDLQTIWTRQTCPTGVLGSHTSGIAIDESSQRLFISCTNYYHQRWQLLNGSITYCGGWVSLDMKDGNILWTTSNPACYDPSGDPFNRLSNGRALTAFAVGAPAVANDIILVGSTDTVYTPRFIDGLPLSINNDFDRKGRGGYVYALKKSNGKISSSFETGASVYGSFSINRECVFIGHGYGIDNSAGLSPHGKELLAWCIINRRIPVIEI